MIQMSSGSFQPKKNKDELVDSRDSRESRLSLNGLTDGAQVLAMKNIRNYILFRFAK